MIFTLFPRQRQVWTVSAHLVPVNVNLSTVERC
jgi:hypothetical protein